MLESDFLMYQQKKSPVLQQNFAFCYCIPLPYLCSYVITWLTLKEKDLTPTASRT